MTFAADLKRFQVRVTTAVPSVLRGVAEKMHESITVGSPVTGAPGQPVDTGYLRASWQVVYDPTMTSATIGTNVAYAPVIEYGTRTAFDPRGTRNPNRTNPDGSSRRAIKSTVGGIGSVRLTIGGADNLQRLVVAEVRGG